MFKFAGAFLALALLSTPAFSQVQKSELAVGVTNLSKPNFCAEDDNVELDFHAPNDQKLRSFLISAAHPAYIGMIVKDNDQPDFTACDMSHDTVVPTKTPTIIRRTFWETPKYWLTGYTYPSFWRAAKVPFKVGDKVFNDLHLVQLWTRFHGQPQEILVVYPPDGYWRARPLTPDNLTWTAYGSSFLVGPVEVAGRPIVDLKDIAFDPATITFTMHFQRGGSATLHIVKADQDHLAMQVVLSDDVPKNFPFAALRSMFTTTFNNDVARVAWRRQNGKSWHEAPIMDFPGDAAITQLWAGRTVPSRHNLSAPDMMFSQFSTEAK